MEPSLGRKVRGMSKLGSGKPPKVILTAAGSDKSPPFPTLFVLANTSKTADVVFS
jgi:hypothetical protein